MPGCAPLRPAMLSRFLPTLPRMFIQQLTENHSSMQYKVVLVPFPFDDLSGSKVRPAVCLTGATGVHRHVVLSFVTSTVPSMLEPTDILLDPGSADFARTGLRVRSTLRLHRMVTVSAAIIQRQLGVMTPKLQVEVQQRLRTLFAL
jgi:mRNA interferase MazF